MRTTRPPLLTYGMIYNPRIMLQALQALHMAKGHTYDVRKVTDDGVLRLGDQAEWLWGRHVVVMEQDGKLLLDPVEVEG